MKKRIFTGAGVAIVTPMNQDGTVNYEVFGQIVEEQIVRSSAVALRHRYTLGGVVIWKKVKVEIKFIGSHTEG